MSGVTPKVFAANMLPVRPKPVMTSSKMSRMLNSSQSCRRIGRYSGGGVMIPPVLLIGSTMMAAIERGSSHSIICRRVRAQKTSQSG